MRARHGRLARRAGGGGGDGEQGQALVEGGQRLLRIGDDRDRTVPNLRQAARITDRDERRKGQRTAAVPALGDDLGADASGITERNGEKRRVQRPAPGQRTAIVLMVVVMQPPLSLRARRSNPAKGSWPGFAPPAMTKAVIQLSDSR
jgi:hypothetical protein